MDARHAVASGADELIDADALAPGANDDDPVVGLEHLMKSDLDGDGSGTAPCPISDCVRRRGVMVRSRSRFWVGSSSLSTSSSSSEVESSESEEVCAAELFGLEGDHAAAEARFDWDISDSERAETVDARFLETAPRRSVSAADGGRKGGEGDSARLLRACASRNAATEMRCDESDPKLSSRTRGRGRGKGVSVTTEGLSVV